MRSQPGAAHAGLEPCRQVDAGEWMCDGRGVRPARGWAMGKGGDMRRKLFSSGLGASLVAAVVVGVSLASASLHNGARVWAAPASMAYFAKAGV